LDRAGSQAVALVNRSLADRYWPDGDAVGQRILVHFLGRPMLREIVGIVGDSRQASLTEAARPEIFVPHLQNPFGSMTFVVRAEALPAEFLESVKREIRIGAPGLSFATASTMKALIAETLEPRKLSLRVLGFFSLVALLLAGLGVYGLVSSTTQHRRHEIGLRMALGGRPFDILRMLLGEGSAWILAGLAAGSIAAVSLSHLLERFLFGIRHYDPLTLLTVGTVMCLVGFVAILIPARAAMALDPMNALRHD
ncbi:MAG: hypothetical protein MI919_26190, partial [Holophagales bacterium]|nr:hypothetical protein [Holophagales bacterium]